MGATRGRIPRVAALDGFRAYAILGVVVLHLIGVSGVLAASEGGPLNTVIWGLLGNVIDVFFILSGFVLFLGVVVRSGELGGLGRFAVGRASRLLPAYWLCLLLALVLVFTLPATPSSLPIAAAVSVPSPGDVVVHLTAMQSPVRLFDSGLTIGFGLDPPLWMISVIVGFYIVFPMVARTYFRHPLLGLLAAAAITLSWKIAVEAGVFDGLAEAGVPAWAIRLAATDQLPGWAFSFGLGMTGAWAYAQACERWPREVMARWALALLPAAVLAYLFFAYLYGQAGEQASGPITGAIARSDPLESLGSSFSRAAVMAAIALGPFWLQRPFANRVTTRVAQLSYGLYLVHFIVILYAARYLGLPTDGTAAALALWCAVVLPVSFAYAYCSRRLVEEPVRTRFRRPRLRVLPSGGPAQTSSRRAAA